MPHSRLNWMLIKENDKQLHLYSVELAPDAKFFDASDRAAVLKEYETNNDPLSKIVFETCAKPMKKENDFLFTVAYALFLAAGQKCDKTFFKRVFGDNEDTLMIREWIAQTITTGQIPRAIADAAKN